MIHRFNIHMLGPVVAVAGLSLLVPPRQLRAQKCPSGTCTTVTGITDSREGKNKLKSTSGVKLQPESGFKKDVKIGDRLRPGNSLHFGPDNLWLKFEMKGDTKGRVTIGPGGPYRLTENFGLLEFRADPGARMNISSSLKAGSFRVWMKYKMLTVLGTEIVIVGDSSGTDSIYVKKGCIALSELPLANGKDGGAGGIPDRAPCDELEAADTTKVDRYLEYGDSLQSALKVAGLALRLDCNKVERISSTAGIDRLTALLVTMNRSLWSRWYDPLWMKAALGVGAVILVGTPICIAAPGCLDGPSTSTGKVVVTGPD
ncbi:MAG: hypothetical protein ACC655_07600 [Rhodothermia bacterium]